MAWAVEGLPRKARETPANERAFVTFGPTSLGVGARRVVEALRDKHIDPAPLLFGVGLETVLDCRNARIPAAAEVQLIEQAADVAADPTFGLSLAALETPGNGAWPSTSWPPVKLSGNA